MELTKTQATVAEDRHRFRVVNCGRRGGKSTLSVLEMIGKAVYGKDRIIAYVAPTYKQARDIAWEMLKKMAQPVITDANESRLEITIKTVDLGTSKIILRGWESVESFRGMKIDFLVLDEVASYRDFWTGWHEVLRACLADTRGEALFISTPKGFNHFYDLYNLEQKDTDYKSFHFTSYDNPYIPKDELDKAAKEMTEDRFAQEYMADFRKTEGLVYKEFDRNTHLVDKIPESFNEIMCGVDFGYTNPTGILKIGVDKDSNYWVLDEFYKSKQTTDQIIDVCHIFKPNMVYPDPAEPDRIQQLNSKGLNCREVSKDVEAGIDKVREMFKQGRIKIKRDCVNLIWELETYSYPEKKSFKNENEQPIKENDHLVDCLRYAIYSHRPINNYAEMARIRKNEQNNVSLVKEFYD